jgi:uncharacterized DUF497 family protein
MALNFEWDEAKARANFEYELRRWRSVARNQAIYDQV